MELPGHLQSHTALTPREQEIITHLANIKANAEIAADLGISQRTVEKHVEHILRKLSVKSRATAVATWQANNKKS